MVLRSMVGRFGLLCLTQRLVKSSIIGIVLDGWTSINLGGPAGFVSRSPFRSSWEFSHVD
jgi:hypothetical protein